MSNDHKAQGEAALKRATDFLWQNFVSMRKRMALEDQTELFTMLHAIASTPPAPAVLVEDVPSVDYQAAIHHCFKTLGHAQGTKGCIAFARGAEWMHGQFIAAIAKATGTTS